MNHVLSEVECVRTMALYRYFSQDRSTLPKRIMGESSTLTQNDLEKPNAKVKHNIECEAAKLQKA